MKVAHAVHWLVAAPAALVLLWIAVATLLESRLPVRVGRSVVPGEPDQRAHGCVLTGDAAA